MTTANRISLRKKNKVAFYFLTCFKRLNGKKYVHIAGEIQNINDKNNS